MGVRSAGPEPASVEYFWFRDVQTQGEGESLAGGGGASQRLSEPQELCGSGIVELRFQRSMASGATW
jgi:hypothetical protein